MKVRCIKLVNPNTGRSEESNSWLSIGKTYHVMCLSIEPGQVCKLRLIGDDNRTPALHDIRQFELISSFIPPSWVVNFLLNGYVEFGPAIWNEKGFWEQYFDDDSKAIQIFEEERKKIIDFDP